MLLVVLTVATMYAMVYIDVCLRARHAYQEGEKYWNWHEHPEIKRAELQKKFDLEKKEIDQMLSNKKIRQVEYDRKLEIITFERDRELEESSIKYAYVWYQTSYELFSPPESKWVKLSRQKAPLAKELWKEELRSQHIAFEDYMLD